ncbi:unnamed protein product [Rotaria magnacalcarata]|uniref:Uncharacterized protein n=1 Tax=Rotaria magnacalcarata TaxID=392030 RepID=A0A816V007_9BILA|nr:unnamed protein product [Rotaria magnacalcarata]CAF1603840.1 unnamed protein product [Rotaria magnacalcarata]CAF2057096.1 unnamed protein product [Rotaria magnacalcarata]CAF2120769.1 unnamed protein product [Rotaria magnacalcarata]CAF2164764.1 unnamed protein product [Rotaria magnacalcarata]
MAGADIDLTLCFRKKFTPPPSVLLLKTPSNQSSTKDHQTHSNVSVELRSRQRKIRHATAHIIGSNSNYHNSDSRDSSGSPNTWQRHSDKIGHIAQAPDVAYRNTYLDEIKREKSATTSSDYRSHKSVSRSPSPRSQHSQQQPLPRLKTTSSSSHHTSDLSPRKHHEYRTVYDYIRQSIKQIERQRNLKQQNFSARVKRPQNDDIILRRILGEKKTSTPRMSSVLINDFRNPQNFLNYVNHSREQVRILHTTTPNQPQQQQQQQQIDYKVNRQRTKLSLVQNQNDSLDKQQAIMVLTATVANS